MNIHRRTMRQIAAGAAAVLLTTTLAACSGGAAEVGSQPQSSAGGDLSVVAVLPISGPVAPFGTATAQGIQAAAAIANAKGGVGGKQIKVTVLDDALDASKAVTVLQDYLASNPKPAAVFPGLASQEVLALLPVTTQNKLFSVDYAASAEVNDVNKFPHAFHVLIPPDAIAQAELTWVKSKGYTKIGFLAPNNASGIASSAAMKTVAAAQGVGYIDTLVDPATTDATPSLEKLKAGNPDVLIFDGLGPFGKVFVDSRAKLGWDVPTIGSPTFASNNLGSLPPTSLKGVQMLAWSSSVAGTKLTESRVYQDFRAEIGKLNGGAAITIANPAYVFGYNAGIVMWGALTATGGNTDAAALTAALQENKVPQEIRSLSLGPSDWGYTSSSHFQKFGSDDTTVAAAGSIKDGLLVSSSGS